MNVHEVLDNIKDALIQNNQYHVAVDNFNHKVIVVKYVENYAEYRHYCSVKVIRVDDEIDDRLNPLFEIQINDTMDLVRRILYIEYTQGELKYLAERAV